MNNYTYSVGWSNDDEAFIGTCIEFPALSFIAESYAEALHGIKEVVAQIVAEMGASGEVPPEPRA